MRAGVRRVRARGTGGFAAPSMEVRLPRIIGVREEPAEVRRLLGGHSVIVVGCGAVGRVAAGALARFHPSRMVLVDPKEVVPTTVLTGLACGAEEVGRAKAEVAAEDVLRAAPGTEVREFAGPVQELPLSEWLEADTVVLCGDNLAVEREVGERCRDLGLPLVMANLHGASLVAQVRCFGHGGDDPVCPECLWGEDERRLAEREVRFSCDGSGGVASVVETRSLAHLAGLAGSLAANQVLRLWLSLGASVADTLVEYCGANHRATTLPLRRRAGCPAAHGPRWERRPVAVDPGRWTLETAAAVAGFTPGAPGVWVTVDGRGYAERGHCGCPGASGAGDGRPLHRFLLATVSRVGGADLEARCGACGERLRIAPQDWHPRVTVAGLGTRRGWSFRRLGAGPSPVLVIGDGSRTVVVWRRRSSPDPDPSTHGAGGEVLP